MKMKTVKGTRDLGPKETSRFNKILNQLESISYFYCFSEITLPIIEHAQLYQRTIGETSDIVRKEMYAFKDKGERLLVLRPEFTASIIRTFVNNKIHALIDLPFKAQYYGPIFRYERPQAGRYRQFYQYGVESIGVDSPFVDAEVITYGYDALDFIGIDNIILKINTLGDDDSRIRYREVVSDYFQKHIHNMCDDCKERLETNPLRILDCKVASDQEIIKNAPKIQSYLSLTSLERFNQVIKLLDQSEIPFEIDQTLVRGLDYYSEIVFEYHYFNKEGKTLGALGAGGHYSHLVQELGGPDLPGVGLSFGVDRLVEVLKEIEEDDEEEDYHSFALIYLIPVGDVEIEDVYEVLLSLRREGGYSYDMYHEKKPLKTLIQKAIKRKAKFLIFVGEDELKNNTLTIKNLETEEQTVVDRKDYKLVIRSLFFTSLREKK